MALVDFKYFSPALGMQTALTIVLPEMAQGIGVGGAREESDAPIPALYLLHGTSDDQTIWQRRTSIERYVAEKRLAVVMMTTHLGAYTNQQYGFRYFDFVAKEVPQVCARYFNLSRRREEKFVAGLSMGGYGALKIGLALPEDFRSSARFPRAATASVFCRRLCAGFPALRRCARPGKCSTRRITRAACSFS